MSKKGKRVHPRKRTGRRALSQYSKPLRHLFKKKRAQGLTVCYAVLSYGVFERLAGLEHRHLAGGIGHGLAGTGIAANAGLRDLFRFCQNCDLYALRSGPFRVYEARGGIITLGVLGVLLKRRTAA